MPNSNANAPSRILSNNEVRRLGFRGNRGDLFDLHLIFAFDTFGIEDKSVDVRHLRAVRAHVRVCFGATSMLVAVRVLGEAIPGEVAVIVAETSERQIDRLPLPVLACRNLEWLCLRSRKCWWPVLVDMPGNGRS